MGSTDWVIMDRVFEDGSTIYYTFILGSMVWTSSRKFFETAMDSTQYSLLVCGKLRSRVLWCSSRDCRRMYGFSRVQWMGTCALALRQTTGLYFCSNPYIQVRYDRLGFRRSVGTKLLWSVQGQGIRSIHQIYQSFHQTHPYIKTID